MSLFLVVMMYAVWSSMFSLGKMALALSPPLFLTGSRMVLAGLLLLAFLAGFRRSSLKMSWKQLASLCILGFFSTYLTNAFEFWGLQYLSAAKTCFIYSLSPFFAALFSYLHFKERMTVSKWIGLAVGFIGMIPVLSIQTGSEELLSIVGFITWPALALIAASLCSVYGWVLLRLIVSNQNPLSPPVANSVSMLFGGILAFIHSFFVESWTPLPVASANTFPFATQLIVMTLISNILCYNLYGMLLKRFTATLLSFFGLLSPLFASLNGWLLLGEPPSAIIFLSTAIVSAGLWIVYRAELKQGYIAPITP